MNFIPFSRWDGSDHSDAPAIVSRIGHLVKIGSTASSLNDKDHVRTERTIAQNDKP